MVEQGEQGKQGKQGELGMGNRGGKKVISHPINYW